MDEYESNSYSSDDDDPVSSVHADCSIQLPSKTSRVESLLDLAVKVTAKHLSCEQIQQQQPVQDDTVLKKVQVSHCCIHKT